MAKREDIAHFLEDFKVKMGLWNIIYRDDRSKNAQTLLDLELTPYQRTDIIKNLQVEDYCEGPTSDKLNGGADKL